MQLREAAHVTAHRLGAEVAALREQVAGLEQQLAGAQAQLRRLRAAGLGEAAAGLPALRRRRGAAGVGAGAAATGTAAVAATAGAAGAAGAGLHAESSGARVVLVGAQQGSLGRERQKHVQDHHADGDVHQGAIAASEGSDESSSMHSARSASSDSGGTDATATSAPPAAVPAAAGGEVDEAASRAQAADPDLDAAVARAARMELLLREAEAQLQGLRYKVGQYEHAARAKEVELERLRERYAEKVTREEQRLARDKAAYQRLRQAHAIASKRAGGGVGAGEGARGAAGALAAAARELR